MRNKVIAHSDATEWDINIQQGEYGGLETSSRDPFEYLSLEEAQHLIDNTQAIRSQLSHYKRSQTMALTKSLGT